MARVVAASGRSTLITSAPRSPSSIAANGPASTREKSATRRPSSGPGPAVTGAEPSLADQCDARRLRSAPRLPEATGPAAPPRPARAAAGGRGGRRPARDPRRRARAARGRRSATRPSWPAPCFADLGARARARTASSCWSAATTTTGWSRAGSTAACRPSRRASSASSSASRPRRPARSPRGSPSAPRPPALHVRLPRHVAARRRLRDPRPLLRPPRDGADLRAPRRRRDGALASSTCPSDGATADDYEAVLAPLYAWMHALDQRSENGAMTARRRRLGARLGRAGGRGAAPPPDPRRRARRRLRDRGRRLNAIGLGPLDRDLSRPGAAPRRPARHARGAAAPRRQRAVRALGPLAPLRPVAARRPRGVDDARAARASSTPARWVYQPHFLTPEPNRSPYWPGTAVAWSRTTGRRELVRLLGDRGHEELRPQPGVKQVAWHGDARADLELQHARGVARRARSAGTQPGSRRPRSRAPLTRTAPAPSSTAHTPPAS